ncbi:MAG TPA: histidine kinase, partial [Jatrophihabitantaceae bacterium]|nr:histidine kinase [Jatrophihabitantaceae bacterium]
CFRQVGAAAATLALSLGAGLALRHHWGALAGRPSTTALQLQLYCGVAAVTVLLTGAAMARRHQLAATLHDVVIQRIFSVGLRLDAASGHADRSEVDLRIRGAIDMLDETIEQLRASIVDADRSVLSLGADAAARHAARPRGSRTRR